MRSVALAIPLRNPVYRRLFSAQVIGLMGTGLSTVGLGLLAFDMAGGDAGEVLGVVLGLRVATYVVVSPAVATFASRVPRKTLLVTLDAIRALAIASVVFVDAVWQIYVLIVIVSAASAGFTPAFQALLPEIFEDVDTYTEALSIHRLAYEIEALLSPALAGILLGLVSYSALFAMNAVAFIASAGLVLAAAIPALIGDGELAERGVRQVHQGIVRFLAIPRLRGLLALDLAVAAGGAMVIINTVVYVKGDFGLGDSEVAWGLGAFGAGSMAVALLLPRVVKSAGDRTVMVLGGALLAASMLLTWIAVESLPVLLGCWILAGAGTSMVLTPSGRLIQRSGDSAERPSLFAAQFSLSHLCWLLTYPIAGFAGGALGLPAAAAILAGLATVGTVAAPLLWRSPAPPRARRLVRDS